MPYPVSKGWALGNETQCLWRPTIQPHGLGVEEAQPRGSITLLGLRRFPPSEDSCLGRGAVEAPSVTSCRWWSQQSDCVKEVKHLQEQGTEPDTKQVPCRSSASLDCSLSQQTVGCTKQPPGTKTENRLWPCSGAHLQGRTQAWLLRAILMSSWGWTVAFCQFSV